MSNETKLRLAAISSIVDAHFHLKRCGLCRQWSSVYHDALTPFPSPNKRQAEIERTLEARATTAIQSYWRSYIIRSQFEELRGASVVVQAAYRGYRGRKRALNFAVKVIILFPFWSQNRTLLIQTSRLTATIGCNRGTVSTLSTRCDCDTKSLARILQPKESTQFLW